ncbi:hypothetical protein E2C01_040124 [Portunus trituberculatus]|uniref:Uncharacterized protein n=1 Tax=Portunus trituberculatus TaxID=210409 RepID=A0A5B7FPV8_PORTR|nr:hypothetical protein [Portunus trituberculatus]
MCPKLIRLPGIPSRRSALLQEKTKCGEARQGRVGGRSGDGSGRGMEETQICLSEVGNAAGRVIQPGRGV